MAALTDSMGNTINGSLQELQAAMIKNTNSVRYNTLDVGNSARQTAANTGELKKLAEAMTSLKDVFQADLGQTLRALNDAIANLGSSSSGSASGGDVANKLEQIYKCLCLEDPAEDEKDRTTTFMKSLKKEFKKEEFWVGLVGKMNAEKCCGGGGGKDGGGGGGDKPSGSAEPKRPSGDTPEVRPTREYETDALGNIIAVEAKLLSFFDRLSVKFEQVFFNFGDKIDLQKMLLDDMASQEVNFAREVKKTAFEINNVTGEFMSAQKAFIEVGESVLETGVNRTKYQEEYLKNLRAGIREEKKLQTITKQTLATENLLGLKAGELTDSFRELALAGKMNTAQIAAMGRGMQDVARNTGLTGEALKEAFNATKPFITSLQNAANLTASAAQNVMGIVAESKKLGVDDSVKPLLEAATSTNKLINDSNAQTQAFLYTAAGNVGKIQELQYGIITRTKKGIKDLAKGMELVLQDFGVRSLEEVENLPDEMKFKLNLQLKAAFGMELGEMTRTIEAFKEAGKGVSDRLNDINAKRALSLNMEEKAALAEQERQLKAKAAMDVLTGFSEAAKGAQTMDIAFSNFSRRAGDFREELQAFGGDMGSAQGGLKSALTAATENLNEALKKQGEKEISIDASEIEAALKDKKQLNLLIDRIEAGNNKLQNAQKAATDPTLMTARTLESYNDYFRNSYASPLLQGILTIAGFSGIMATALTLIAAQGALAGGITAKKYGKDFMDLFRGGGEGGGGRRRRRRSGGGGDGPEVTCPTPSFNFNFGQLMRSAGRLALFAVALGAVGMAIVQLGSVAASYVTADPAKTAIRVTSILMSAAVIMGAAGLALVALDRAESAYGRYFTPQAMGRAMSLAVRLTAAAVGFALLATAALKVMDIISSTFGIDAKKAKEIGENVLAIMTTTGFMVAAFAAAAIIVIGLGEALTLLGTMTPALVTNAAIATFVLPIAAMAFLSLSAACIAITNYLIGLMFPDMDSIEEAAEKLDAIVWATIKITTALALASAAMIGIGALSLQLPAALPLWAAAAYGMGILAGAAVFLVAVAWGLSKFFSSMSSVDGTALEDGAENTFRILNGINGIVLRLLPILILIGGIGVALAAAQVFYPAIVAALGPLVFWGTVGAVILPPLITALAALMIFLTSAVANASGIDAESVKGDMEQFGFIMDTTYKILSKLAGIFALVVGLSTAAALLITFAPAVALALAILLPLITVTLPGIVASMLAVGIGIINAIKDTTKGFTLDKKEVDEMVAKIETLGNAITTIGTAVGKFAGKGIYQAADNISKFSSQIGNFLSTLGNLKSATSSFKPNEMKDLASNLTSVMEITRAVFGIIAETQKFQITGAVLGTGLQNANQTIIDSATTLKDYINNLMSFGQTVALATMKIDTKKVSESFVDLGKFVKEIEKFMATVSKIKPNKKFKKSAQEMFMKSSLSEPLMNMMKEFKKVAGIQKTAGLNRNELIMTSEVLAKVGEFTMNLTKAVENFEKSSKMLGPKGFLSKKNEYGDGTTIKDNITKILGVVDNIILAVMPYAQNSSIGADIDIAIAQLQAIGPVFEALAKATETFSAGAKKIVELSTSGRWWWSDISVIEKLEQTVNTGSEGMTRFANTVRVIFTSFDTIVASAVAAKKTPQAMKDTATTLEQLQEATATFTRVSTSFGTQMEEFFDTAWSINPLGTEGKGTFLSNRSKEIIEGFQNIFGILNSMKTAFDSFDVANSNTIVSKCDAASKFIKEMSTAMNGFTAAVTSLSDLLSGKWPNYKFLTDTTTWNTYYDRFQQLEWVGKAFFWITHPLEKGLEFMGKGSVSEINTYVATILSIVNNMAALPAALNKAVDAIQEIIKAKLPAQTDIDQITAQAGPITNMIKGFNSVINALSSANFDPAKSQKALDNLKAITDVIMPLVKALQMFETMIYQPINTGTGMLSEASTKNMEQVGFALDKFFQSFLGILRGIDAGGTVKEEDFASAVKKLNFIGSISTTLSGSLITFNKEISLFNVPDPKTGKTKAEEISAAANAVGSAITSIGELVALLKTTLNRVPNETELTDITKKITGLGSAATGLKDLFESVHKIMLTLTNTETFGESLIDGATKQLQQAAGVAGRNKIANFIHLLTNGLFVPLLDLKIQLEGSKRARYLDEDDLDEAAKKITHLATGMKAMGSLFDSVRSIMVSQGELNKQSDGAAAAAKAAGDTKIKGSSFQRLNEMLTQNSPIMKEIIGKIGNITKTFMTGDFEKFDSDDIKEVKLVLEGVQAIFSMFSGEKSIIKTVDAALREIDSLPSTSDWEGAGEIPELDAVLPPSFLQQVDSMANFIGQFMQPMSKVIDKILNTNVGGSAIDSADMKEAADILTGMSSILVSMPQIIKTLSAELPNVMKLIPDIDKELAKAGGKTPAEQGKAVGNLFNNSFAFLAGIFSNVTSRFEDAQEVGIATETLTAIVPFTNALVANLPTISKNMSAVLALDLSAFLQPPPKGVAELFTHVNHYAVILIATNMPEIATHLSVAADGIVNVGSNFENFYNAWQANVSNISTKFNEIVAYDLTLATAVDYAAARTFFSALDEYVELLAYYDLDILADNLEMAADTIPAVGFGVSFLAEVFQDNMPLIQDSLDYIGSINFNNMGDIQFLGMGFTLYKLWKLSEMLEDFELDVIAESINLAAENIWNIDEAVTSLIEAYSALMTSMSGLTDISSMADVIEGLQFAASFSAAGQIAVAGGDNAARQEVATRVSMTSSDLLDGAVAAATQATAENTSILVQQNDAIIGILQGMSSMSGGGEEPLPDISNNDSNYNPSKYYAYSNLAGSSVLGSPNFSGRKG